MQRAFVVGNGPSLANTPLDKLVGEVSFATNRIHLIYPTTKWRPTHYVRAEEAFGLEDAVWMPDLLAQIKEPNMIIHTNQYFIKRLEGFMSSLGVRDRILRLKACTHYTFHFDQVECPHTWHEGLCTFGSSVNVAIQMAVQMGYSPIYLIGCDLGYRDDVQSHFASDYINVGSEHLRGAHYANMDTLAAHMVAKRSSPVPIYNATVGGSLEVYPRVKFEELFNA
jgi:hypothetical protein